MYAYAASEGRAVAQEFVGKINEVILFPLITFMMALALLIFLYGAFEYVKGAASDSDRETGKRHLLYGIIGMLVMLSAYSLLTIAAGDNVVRLLPPLIITTADVQEAFTKLERACRALIAV